MRSYIYLLVLWIPQLFSMEPARETSTPATVIPDPPIYSLTDELVSDIQDTQNLKDLQSTIKKIDSHIENKKFRKEITLDKNTKKLSDALARKLSELKIPLNLSIAIKNNYPLETIQLLIRAGVPLNKADTEGYTPLMRAVSRGDFNMVQLLINGGADIGKVHPISRMTALDIAQNKGKKQITHILDVYANFFRNLQYNNTEKVKKLVNNLNVNTLYEGKYPLSYAVANSNKELVQLLLDKGAEINARDEYNKTALDYATSEKIIKILLKYGASLEKKS